jgi:hypothetical protein
MPTAYLLKGLLVIGVLVEVVEYGFATLAYKYIFF